MIAPTEAKSSNNCVAGPGIARESILRTEGGPCHRSRTQYRRPPDNIHTVDRSRTTSTNDICIAASEEIPPASTATELPTRLVRPPHVFRSHLRRKDNTTRRKLQRLSLREVIHHSERLPSRPTSCSSSEQAKAEAHYCRHSLFRSRIFQTFRSRRSYLSENEAA